MNMIVFNKKASRFHFSRAVTILHDLRLPERAVPAGCAALIDALQLSVTIPRQLSAIGPRHKTYTRDGWSIYTPRQ